MNKFIQDVAHFHEKFGLGYNGSPRQLDAEELKFRNNTHFEEAREYFDATELEDKLEDKLEDQLDALVDLCYFAIGTAYRQGLPFEAAWERVHEKNMQKRLASSAEESLRGFKRDIVKPEGWTPPVLLDLVTHGAPVQKPRLIVVEGPDACGKTTLGKAIAKEIGGVYWHLTATRNLTGAAQFDYQVNAFENVRDALATGQSVVLDRFWVSEYCYGSTLRDISWSDVSPIKTLFDLLNPYVIYCLDKTVDAAIERHKDNLDDDHPYDDEQFRSVYEAYLNFVKMSESKLGTKNATVKLFDSTPDWRENQHQYIVKLRKDLRV